MSENDSIRLADFAKKFRRLAHRMMKLEEDYGDEAPSPDPEFEALKFFSVPEKSVCS